MTWARAEKVRAFIIIYSIAQAMSVSGHDQTSCGAGACCYGNIRLTVL